MCRPVTLSLTVVLNSRRMPIWYVVTCNEHTSKKCNSECIPPHTTLLPPATQHTFAPAIHRPVAVATSNMSSVCRLSAGATRPTCGRCAPFCRTPQKAAASDQPKCMTNTDDLMLPTHFPASTQLTELRTPKHPCITILQFLMKQQPGQIMETASLCFCFPFTKLFFYFVID